MKSITQLINKARWAARLVPAGAILAAGGCNGMIKPFVDDVPVTAEVSTASVVGVREALQRDGGGQQRGWQ